MAVEVDSKSGSRERFGVEHLGWVGHIGEGERAFIPLMVAIAGVVSSTTWRGCSRIEPWRQIKRPEMDQSTGGGLEHDGQCAAAVTTFRMESSIFALCR